MAILDEHQPPAATSLRFGDFELRLDSGELLRSGVRVKLQLRPARVLAVLALHAGEVVSREEIRQAVWGKGSHVDFDLALNYCIRQIRRALDDSAEQPCFVATLPRVGYRFIAPVEVRSREPAPPLRSVPSPATPAVPQRTRSIWRQIFAGALALLALASLIALRSWGARTHDHDLPAARSATPAIPEEAMRAYLEGQYFAAHAQSDKARDAFQRAAGLAPGYAPAWAALAHALLEDQRPARELEPLVEAAERRALTLDPQLALAHLNRAERLFRFEYDWREAEQEFRRALALDPQEPEAHFEYATLLAARGRHPEALEQVEQSLNLQPELQLRAPHPWVYYLARRYDEAIARARRQIELAPATTSETNPTQPELFWAFRTLVLASLAKGDREAALVAARAEARWLGNPEPASLDDFWADKERRFAKLGPNRPWYRVVPAIELGDRERALDLLFQQCRERSDAMIPFLRVDPLYDGLRSHPRFRELLRCANLADAPV
ncbi:MAG TPA: winged helix-turn-helix domain-containing protein [Thermoanaerobaculia bacterium]|nr:winged helix-turn-helix domain-containing protein [Thermoanaerobaculia bacterium]